jgi:hypothetical protein
MYRMPALPEARAFPPGHPKGIELQQVLDRQDSPGQAPEPQEALVVNHLVRYSTYEERMGAIKPKYAN